MIQELKNPITNNYLTLKNEVLSSDFSWYYIPSTVQNEKSEYACSAYFSHAVLKPPHNPNLYSTIFSPYSEYCNMVLKEIFEINQIQVNSVMRINFNLTLPLSERKTQPHYDHDFPHKNLLIYLNDCDGDTVVCGNPDVSYSPKQDSVVLFEGLHYQYLPSDNRRVVMVVTFI